MSKPLKYIKTKTQKSTNKRQSYEVSFKKDVVEWSLQHGNRAAARHFSLNESCVRRWKIDYEKLKLSTPQRRSFGGPAKGRFSEVETEVVAWLQQMRREAKSVTQKAIRAKAIKIAKEKDIPIEQFRASLGWIRRLMRRNGVSMRRRTTIAQKLPNDYINKLKNYQKCIVDLRRKHNYDFGAIGNAEEIPLYFDMPNYTTIKKVGAETVSIRTSSSEKAKITVMLSVLGDGTKLPPFIILKRKNLPSESLPQGIVVRHQDKGLMTSELMRDWLNSVWSQRPGALHQKRSMLILDHVKDDIKSLRTDLVTIPGGMTSILQVIDVVVNKPFKDHLKELHSAWLTKKDHEFTKSGRLKKPSVSLLCTWILEAWNRVSSKSIVKGFKKCCVTNALDGSESDILWKEEEYPSGEETTNEVVDNSNILEVCDDLEDDSECISDEDYLSDGSSEEDEYIERNRDYKSGIDVEYIWIKVMNDDNTEEMFEEGST